VARERFSLLAFLRASRTGILALGTPGIILGGFYGGVFSPTEAGGVAAVYAILVTKFIYRDITWKGLWAVAISSVYLTAQVFIIVAAAGVYAWLLTVGGVPQILVEFVRSISDEPWIVLIIINVFLLIVGCFVDPASAILVLTPLLIPVVKAHGIDLIHFGVIMAVNLEIGMFTPPVGLNIFVAQAMFKTPLRIIYTGIAPFFFVNLIALGIVTYVPELSLYLTQFIK
jgi:C4-dicarboxylate transporter DctM subunit